MSKLRERIRDLSRRRTAAFGFAAMRDPAQAVSTRQVLVVAEVDDTAATQLAANAGADAVIYSGPLGRLPEIIVAAEQAIVGARVDAATKEDAAALVAAGADFLVCSDEHSDAAALHEQHLGYLVVASDMTALASGPENPAAEALRLLRPLDLDGVLISGLPERMTIREQLRARRVSELVRKPLFARVSSGVTADTLELWRDAGVVAVVADAASIPNLASAANAVPAPRQRADEHREANVPAPHVASFEDDDDDDEP